MQAVTKPLRLFTTLAVGGPAPLLFATSAEELHALVARSSDDAMPIVMGGGSNVVVSDRGLAAPVIIYRAAAANIRLDPDGTAVVDGACSLRALVQVTTSHGFAGLESLAGIPGTVGGAVVQNVGAYGTELSDVLLQVDVLDLQSRTISTLSRDDCMFSYRSSRFKQDTNRRFVILGATLQLTPSGTHHPTYEDLACLLANEYGSTGGSYSLQDVSQAVVRLRRGKGMVYNAGDANSWSVGSFFTNPVVSESLLCNVADVLQTDSIPTWPVADGRVKVSAAYLLEHVGFHRGYTYNGVRTSPRHALALTNFRGDATASDVLTLAGAMVERVHDKLGILLRPEPKLLGFTTAELGVLADQVTV